MTHLPIPHQPSYKWWFSVYCSKPKIQKRRWGDCGFGDGMKRGGGLVLAFPLHPSSSDPPDPRGEAWGPQHLGRAFKAKGTAELSGSPWGVPWAKEAPGVAGELSSPPRVQKPVGREGRGRPLVWQLRRGGSGGRMLVYLLYGPWGHQSPLVGPGDYLHGREERSQGQGPVFLPAQHGERRGVLGPAALVLGFRWKLHTPVYPGDREMGSVAGRGWDGRGKKMGGGVHLGGEGPGVFKITLS